MHKNHLVSVADGIQAKATRLFGHCHSFLTHRVTTPMVNSIPPEEIATHFVQLVADLLRYKGGLHGINGNGGNHRFNKGSSSRYG